MYVIVTIKFGTTYGPYSSYAEAEASAARHTDMPAFSIHQVSVMPAPSNAHLTDLS